MVLRLLPGSTRLRAVVSAVNLPTIDIAPLLAYLDAGTGSAAAQAGVRPAIAQIVAACERWGAFIITGHGLSTELGTSVWRHTRDFFRRPLADKQALARSGDNPWGYYDRELTKNRRDRKEIFDFGPERALGPTDDGPFSARNQWPDEPVDFRSVLQRYYQFCYQLSLRLLEALCLGLELPADRLSGYFAPDHTSFMRLNYYPVDDPLASAAPGAVTAPGDLGVHHHTDAGGLTILAQDGDPALQIQREGGWHLVRPGTDALVVNIGDMVQVWSNDRLRAPVHRVLASRARIRASIPFFLNPAYGADVAPLAPLVDASRPARYRVVNWGDFRRRRADGDYADRGHEVQISDYLHESSQTP